jgi:hypothetical protein
MARKFQIPSLLAAVGATFLTAASASAAVPDALTQQGRLFDSSGNPATGSVSMVFTIYDAATAGSSLWTETRDVTLDSGYFSVRLGETLTIPDTVFTGATRHLGVKIGADEEMTPRQALVSVPYAFMANNAVGDITPSSISVNGAPIVNSLGEWVGPNSGLVGPAGPAGPSGIVGSAFASGSGSTPAATLNFLAPTVTVTLVAGNKIYVSSNKALGTSSASAGDLDLWICHRPSGSTAAPTTVGGAIFNNSVTSGTRIPMSMNAVITGLAAGNYQVGMCGVSSQGANWNNNEWGYTSALVFN